MNKDIGKTIKFKAFGQDSSDAKAVLRIVYDALEENGYDPINQIVGYIVSEDPTYITSYKDARRLISQIDRDALLSEMIENFINN